MAREIGWSIPSNLLYDIKKKLGCDGCKNEPPLTTTSTTTTTLP
jgi:hypothetical protein